MVQARALQEEVEEMHATLEAERNAFMDLQQNHTSLAASMSDMKLVKAKLGAAEEQIKDLESVKDELERESQRSKTEERHATQVYNQAMLTLNVERESHQKEVEELQAELRMLKQQQEHKTQHNTELQTEFAETRSTLQRELIHSQEALEESRTAVRGLEKMLAEAGKERTAYSERMEAELAEAMASDRTDIM